MAPGLKARLWIGARDFYSSARSEHERACWCWLLGDDGRLSVLRLNPTDPWCNGNPHPDRALAREWPTLRALSPGQTFNSPRLGEVHALSSAPLVPVPRWSLSWGHPLQRAIRRFAALLDSEVIDTLGDLEEPGPYLGSVVNYNALAMLPEPTRTHRLQALRQFPPLVVPLLLSLHPRVDLSGQEGMPQAPVADDARALVLAAMDEGRDLIGALARFAGVSRGLIRSPLCRRPWGTASAAPHVLHLLDAIPTHARPRDDPRLEERLRLLSALPLGWHLPTSVAHAARAFRCGWEATWTKLEKRHQALDSALKDSADFLRSALVQVAIPEGLDDIDIESVCVAWLARLGLGSLLEASRRWHAQDLIDAPWDDGLPATVTALVDRFGTGQGTAREITRRRDLIAEGDAMDHCVADYWHDCVFEGTRIFHLARPSGARATAEYRFERHGEGGRFKLEQLRGPRNGEPDGVLAALADSLESALNAGERADSRAALAETMERNRARFGAGRRRALRRLDPRGRRELNRVLQWLARQEIARATPTERLRTPIAGFRYGAGSGVLGRLAPGARLTLVREPENPHDANAVRVDWQGVKLGYLPRAVNAAIARALDAMANASSPGDALEARVHSVDMASDRYNPVQLVIHDGPHLRTGASP
ncbi:MAG: HIRAN domain-containing protein [Gammaproteobacteria bacterium]